MTTWTTRHEIYPSYFLDHFIMLWKRGRTRQKKQWPRLASPKGKAVDHSGRNCKDCKGWKSAARGKNGSLRRVACERHFGTWEEKLQVCCGLAYCRRYFDRRELSCHTWRRKRTSQCTLTRISRWRVCSSSVTSDVGAIKFDIASNVVTL